MSSLRETMLEVCRNGEVVRIVYHGGSQPGTARDISVITVSDLEIRARDLAVGKAKVFKLAKIELVQNSSPTPSYDPNAPQKPEPVGTIGDVLQHDVSGLIALGWHVNISDNDISLHRFFKNGKPRKTADLSLWYDEYTQDLVMGEDGSLQIHERKSSRPFHLRSKNYAVTKTFLKMSSAITGFLNEAKTLAPNEIP